MNPKPNRVNRKGKTGKGLPKNGVKPIYREKMLVYMSDPENPPLTRNELAENLLGVSRTVLYTHFTPQELAVIEAEGLELRRSRCAGTSAQVDKALVKKALEGDVPAIKLYYQKVEGWSERSTVAVEPNLEELRALAISKGYDPEEYVATYLAIKRGGPSGE